MNILVAGGAGFIGSHTVEELIKNKHTVTVLDNLQTGHRESVSPKAEFYQGDVRDKELLSKIFEKGNFDAVIHFAANLLVEESMKHPLRYFDNNVYGLIVLLEVMNQFQVKNIIFSSTAAVYGEPNKELISERDSTNPKNPYGESKRMMEQVISWCQKAYGINYIALRYFNVAGANFNGHIGEDHFPETHLLPIVFEVAAGKRAALTVYGDDYDTPDGTCIRDYVHVVDLANAHILAMDDLHMNKQSGVFNVGSSNGFSVLEIIQNVETYTGKKVPYIIGKRRSGDPSCLVASSEKIRAQLNWEPKYTNLKDIIESAWKWHSKHPNGYEDKDSKEEAVKKEDKKGLR